MLKKNDLRKAQQKTGSRRNKRSFLPPHLFNEFDSNELDHLSWLRTTTSRPSLTTKIKPLQERVAEFWEDYQAYLDQYRKIDQQIKDLRKYIDTWWKQSSIASRDLQLLLSKYSQYSKNMCALPKFKGWSYALETTLNVDSEAKKEIYLNKKNQEDPCETLHMIQQDIDNEKEALLDLIFRLKNYLTAQSKKEAYTEEQKKRIFSISNNINDLIIDNKAKNTFWGDLHSWQPKFKRDIQQFKESIHQYDLESTPIPPTTSLPSPASTPALIQTTLGLSSLASTLIPPILNATESLIKHLSNATNATGLLEGNEFNATQSNMTDLITASTHPSSTEEFTSGEIVGAIGVGVAALVGIGIGVTLFYKKNKIAQSHSLNPENPEQIETEPNEERMSMLSQDGDCHSQASHASSSLNPEEIELNQITTPKRIEENNQSQSICSLKDPKYAPSRSPSPSRSNSIA